MVKFSDFFEEMTSAKKVPCHAVTDEGYFCSRDAVTDVSRAATRYSPRITISVCRQHCKKYINISGVELPWQGITEKQAMRKICLVAAKQLGVTLVDFIQLGDYEMKDHDLLVEASDKLIFELENRGT